MRWGLLLVVVVVAVLAGVALWFGSQSAPFYTAGGGVEPAVTSHAVYAPPAVSQQTAPQQAVPSIETRSGREDASQPSTGASPTGSEVSRRSKPRSWGPPVLLLLDTVPRGPFEAIYTGLRAVEMDYFTKPKRNDTVVRTFGLLDEVAREEIKDLPFKSSSDVVEFMLRGPLTVLPEEFQEFLARLSGRVPVGDVYLASRLEYAVFVTRRNETTAGGPVAAVLVLDDDDFRRFSRRYLGFEVDPCSNAILLPSGYGTSIESGQEVEAFLPLAWYGIKSNAARAYFHVNAVLKVYLLDVDGIGAFGVVGRCFAESFIDVPLFRSHAIVEVPQEAWVYVHRSMLVFVHEKALQHPEKIEWLAGWYRTNSTRVFEWFRTMLTEYRKELAEEAAKLGLD